jgi:predicted nucleic acid-binding protein
MNEAYLLDTNVICALADANRSGHAPVRQRFQQVDPQFVLLPTMAVAEMEFGMARAANVRPEKRDELRRFISRFEQLPFDENCVQPYSVVRAELWRMHGTTRQRGKRFVYDEKHPEQLCEKVTGTELGIDEPDLIIASVAIAQNLVLVTNDTKAGMSRVKEAAEKVYREGSFPIQLRTENWLATVSG